MNHEEMLKIEGHVFYASTSNVGFAFGKSGSVYTTMSDGKYWTKTKEGDGILDSEEYKNASNMYTNHKGKAAYLKIDKLSVISDGDCIECKLNVGNVTLLLTLIESESPEWVVYFKQEAYSCVYTTDSILDLGVSFDAKDAGLFCVCKETRDNKTCILCPDIDQKSIDITLNMVNDFITNYRAALNMIHTTMSDFTGTGTINGQLENITVGGCGYVYVNNCPVISTTSDNIHMHNILYNSIHEAVEDLPGGFSAVDIVSCDDNGVEYTEPDTCKIMQYISTDIVENLELSVGVIKKHESRFSIELEKTLDGTYGLIYINNDKVQLSDGINTYQNSYIDETGNLYEYEEGCVSYWISVKDKDIAYMEDSLGVNLSRKLWDQIYAESKLDQEAINNLNLNEACLSDSDANKAPWLQ